MSQQVSRSYDLPDMIKDIQKATEPTPPAASPYYVGVQEAIVMGDSASIPTTYTGPYVCEGSPDMTCGFWKAS